MATVENRWAVATRAEIPSYLVTLQFHPYVQAQQKRTHGHQETGTRVYTAKRSAIAPYGKLPQCPTAAKRMMELYTAKEIKQKHTRPYR